MVHGPVNIRFLLFVYCVLCFFPPCFISLVMSPIHHSFPLLWFFKFPYVASLLHGVLCQNFRFLPIFLSPSTKAAAYAKHFRRLTYSSILEEGHRWYVRNIHFPLSVYMASCYVRYGLQMDRRESSKIFGIYLRLRSRDEQLRPACYSFQWCFRLAVIAFRLKDHVTRNMEEVFDGQLYCRLRSRSAKQGLPCDKSRVCSVCAWLCAVCALRSHRGENSLLRWEKL